MNDEPMTAGEWHRQTRIERTLAAGLFLTMAACGLLGSLSAMFVFLPGELTGNRIADGLVVFAVLMTSGLALRQGIFLVQGPVCRACRARLNEDQFRCSRCTALVDTKNLSA